MFKKIYIMAKCGFDEFDILGVYSTKEKAENDLPWMKKIHNISENVDDYGDNICIIPKSVDSNEIYPKDKNVFVVWLRLDNDEITIDKYDYIPSNDSNPNYEMYMDNDFYIRFLIWAKDYQDAENIALERKQKILESIDLKSMDAETIEKKIIEMYPYEYNQEE